MKNKCVLVFLKSPVMGKVKTRLAKHIGDRQAVKLYKHFVADTLKMLENGTHSIIICYYPFNAEKEISEWIGNKYPLWPQKGDTLGKKMLHAFDRAFKQGFEQVILIGTDTPDLPETIIKKGFNALGENDAVIGPSVDGGYYLIGFNTETFLPQAFENITWSTEKVF
ncbi:TIGR04282 family arsenosugar biosynthesis glycosyltransferase, partial [Desulfobacterales bacterium HSG17]|nr:TIGR04282 family arsenosugar biosynthesis glycosyltransferase [Desulfobacterales bacterium HSG17]